MKKKTEHPLVLVQWRDITGADVAWVEKATAAQLKPAVMTSVGLFLEDNEDRLVLASTWENDADSFSEVFVLPRAVVISIKTL